METFIVIFFICSVGLALWFYFSPEIAAAADKKQIKEYKNGIARNANFINFIRKINYFYLFKTLVY